MGWNLRLDELDVEGDVDVFADQDAAGLEGRVPAQAEVLAVDLGGGGEADAGVAPGVFAGRAGAFDGEGDGLGDAMEGQVAGDGVVAFALALDRGGFEGHGGVGLGFEEVGALEVAVALGVAGAEGGDVDGGLDGGVGGVGVSRWRVPERPLKLPFTLEIIMCLTLNSAVEWAGSSFQVVTVAGVVVVVAMGWLLSPVLDARRRYSLQQVFCIARIFGRDQVGHGGG